MDPKTLHGLQHASKLKQVEHKPGCPQASQGYLSKSVAVVYSERLGPIIEILSDTLIPISTDTRLRDLQYILTPMDVSLVETLTIVRNQSSDSGALMSPLQPHFALFEADPPRSIQTSRSTRTFLVAMNPESLVVHSGNMSAEQPWDDSLPGADIQQEIRHRTSRASAAAHY